MGLPAVDSLLKEQPSQLGTRTDCVLEALDIALTNSACEYSDRTTSTCARPNGGTAIGPSHSCDYVEVYMSELDRKLVSTCPVPFAVVTGTPPFAGTVQIPGLVAVPR